FFSWRRRPHSSRLSSAARHRLVGLAVPLVELSPSVVPPGSPPAAGPAPPEEAPREGEDQEHEEQREDEAEGMESPVGVGPCRPPVRRGRGELWSAPRQTARETDAVLVSAHGRDRAHEEQAQQNDRNNPPVHRSSFPPKQFIYTICKDKRFRAGSGSP